MLTGEVGLGDTVLVLGPGTIGQAIALLARLAGAARVIVAGRADAPRFDVLRALGFTELVDVAEAPLKDQVLALTGGRAVDVVLEATGVPQTLVEGMSVLKKGGVIVAAGIHAAPLTLPLTDFVRMRHQLRASHGAERRTWDRVLRTCRRDPEGFRPMITHRLPLERGHRGVRARPPARRQQGDPDAMNAGGPGVALLDSMPGGEGSSEEPSGSCASDAACGARISKGRVRCRGAAVVRAPARGQDGQAGVPRRP